VPVTKFILLQQSISSHKR